jgi:hypothetical protein
MKGSQMISESIFEKYTYDRLRRIKAYQQKYIYKLNGASYQSIFINIHKKCVDI